MSTEDLVSSLRGVPVCCDAATADAAGDDADAADEVSAGAAAADADSAGSNREPEFAPLAERFVWLNDRGADDHGDGVFGERAPPFCGAWTAEGRLPVLREIVDSDLEALWD